MARPRQQYRIQEFREARAALDAYYSSIEELALQLQRLQIRRSAQPDVDNAANHVRENHSRLRRALEGIGFVCLPDPEVLHEDRV